MIERSGHIENQLSNYVRIKTGKNFLFVSCRADRKCSKHFAAMCNYYINLNNIIIVMAER